jgi:hypothetical protein
MITYLLFVGVSTGNGSGSGTTGSVLPFCYSPTCKLLSAPAAIPFALPENFYEFFLAKASMSIVILTKRIPANIKVNTNIKIKKLPAVTLTASIFFIRYK